MVHGVPLNTLEPGQGRFFGTHAYLVSRSGAALLRLYAYPIESRGSDQPSRLRPSQVDAYMLVLQQLGRLRLYLLEGDQPVHQCRGDVEKGIVHHFQPVQCPNGGDPDTNTDASTRLPPPCPPMSFMMGILFIGCILLCVAYVVRYRCVNPPPLDQKSKG